MPKVGKAGDAGLAFGVKHAQELGDHHLVGKGGRSNDWQRDGLQSKLRRLGGKEGADGRAGDWRECED